MKLGEFSQHGTQSGDSCSSLHPPLSHAGQSTREIRRNRESPTSLDSPRSVHSLASLIFSSSQANRSADLTSDYTLLPYLDIFPFVLAKTQMYLISRQINDKNDAINKTAFEILIITSPIQTLTRFVKDHVK